MELTVFPYELAMRFQFTLNEDGGSVMNAISRDFTAAVGALEGKLFPHPRQ